MENTTPQQSELTPVIELPTTPAAQTTPSVPVTGVPPTPPPVPPMHNENNKPPEIKKFLPFFIAFAAILCGVLVFALFQSRMKKPEPAPITTVIVTPTPSPTPIREPTTVSLSGEFSALEASVATLGGAISEFTKEDPSLTPPSLVLPLGF